MEEYSIFGVQDLLQKPFTAATLTDIFDKWTPFTKPAPCMYDCVVMRSLVRGWLYCESVKCRSALVAMSFAVSYAFAFYFNLLIQLT